MIDDFMKVVKELKRHEILWGPWGTSNPGA